ncbi:MAG: ZIP family metal transporter [Gemmatimonadota bacterium]|nr:ZIP family metal transporter [Gemmatimonadota bacterium]
MPKVEMPVPPENTSVKTSQSRPPVRPRAGMPLWFKGLAPLVLLAGLVAIFLKFGPVGVFQQSFPPVEVLTIERIRLPAHGVMEVQIVNGGPEPVTVAQVMVDDANWVHRVDGSRTIDRLERRTITIPYPWVEGEPHAIALVTSTGLTFTGDVAVATLSPSVDARYLTTFALLGVYAGVIPVFIGLLWLPFVRAIHRRWIDFFLSLTMGLLVFLGADALVEAVETSALVAGAFQGPALVLLGLVGTPLILAALGRSRGRERTPLQLAALIALGIGLHNLGEGLAIGASYATGEIALGTFLVIGFLLHNTTEGLGIITPLADQRPRLSSLLLLGALAGVPTVIGAWLGGFTYSPFWTTLFFSIGVGAIIAVVYELWRLFSRRAGGGMTAPLNAAGFLLGMMIMYATGLLVPA